MPIMRTKVDQYDVTVIGGGLSGLCAALYLGSIGTKTVLIDSAIESTQRELGGFARFSGAKFSLPPAGMGLLPIVGCFDQLCEKIATVLEILQLPEKLQQESKDFDFGWSDEEIDPGVSIRRYNSFVLTPSEINDTVCRLSHRVRSVCEIINGECLRLCERGHIWEIEYTPFGKSEHDLVSSTAVFFAGGRMGSSLLVDAGCKETNGKGVDMGLRVEFPDKENLRELREFGPDAKVISDSCRTFCLNVPGKIYRYNFGPISIPGGVVAEAACKAGNVGLLYRHPNKTAILSTIVRKATTIMKTGKLKYLSCDGFLGGAEQPIADIYGLEVANALCLFGGVLEDLGLVDWSQPHYVHIPLLDWHWPTFSMPGTFRSTSAGLYVLGDASGHARGLLQAAASGYIAAEEYMA